MRLTRWFLLAGLLVGVAAQHPAPQDAIAEMASVAKAGARLDDASVPPAVNTTLQKEVLEAVGGVVAALTPEKMEHLQGGAKSDDSSGEPATTMSTVEAPMAVGEDDGSPVLAAEEQQQPAEERPMTKKELKSVQKFNGAADQVLKVLSEAMKKVEPLPITVDEETLRILEEAEPETGSESDIEPEEEAHKSRRKKKNKNKRRKANKNGGKSDLEQSETTTNNNNKNKDGDEVEEPNKRRRKNKNNKNKDKNKNKNKNKDKDTEDPDAVQEADQEPDVAEVDEMPKLNNKGKGKNKRTKKNKNKRKKNKKNKNKGATTRDAKAMKGDEEDEEDYQEEEDGMVEGRRTGDKGKKKHGKGKKGNKKNKKNRKNKKNKGKKNKNKNKNKSRSETLDIEERDDSGPVLPTQAETESANARVTGLSRLARSGDVRVDLSGNHAQFEATFRVGPLSFQLTDKARALAKTQVSTSLDARALFKVKTVRGRDKIKLLRMEVVDLSPKQVTVSRSDLTFDPEMVSAAQELVVQAVDAPRVGRILAQELEEIFKEEDIVQNLGDHPLLKN